MTDKRYVTCIICPVGCRIKVEIEGGNISDISGYGCRRGTEYARDEVTSPKRILTTTVRLQAAGENRVLPVRTRGPIPKGLMKRAVAELKNVSVSPPVRMGDTVLKNVAGSGVDVIASRNWPD